MRLEFSEFKEKYFPLQKNSKNAISNNLFEAKTGNIIKTINFTTHSQWEVWKQNFQLEIEHQIHLNEQFPNHILKIIHWCSQIQSIEIIVYIVYQCDNSAQSLQQYLDRAMISEQQKMSLAQQILEFSIILEQTEIQHRNIKLKNIILIGASIYLTDFGSARTHYNVYTKQATIKEEKHKQLETIFYNSPEIIEIVNEENLDFQEQEWRSLFENEQQKNSILLRNDNWALSVVLLQLINFRTSIPDDLQYFYGYYVSRFDEEIKLYSKVPQYKIIAEVIKKLSFGKVSGSECLNYLKNQQSIEVQKTSKNIQKLELDGLDKMQLKRSLKFKANIDFLYLSNRQIKNLEQVYEEEQKEQLKKLNQNDIQELQIQKQDSLNILGGYEKQESSNSLSYQLNSPKNQEKKLLQSNKLQQIFDQSSKHFENYKLEQYQNSEITQFKKQQNSNLLQKLNDTNRSRQNTQKEKNQEQQQLIVVQQLQKITDSQQIDEQKIQNKQSLTQSEQKQLQLKQIQDTQQFQEQKNMINQKQQVQNEKHKNEKEIFQISDDNQGSTMFSRAAQQQQGQEQTQNIIDFSQFESQQKMFQLSQVYKEIQKFNENLQSSRLNEQLQKSSKTENFSQISTQLPQVLEKQKSLNLRKTSKLEKIEKNPNKEQNLSQNFQNQKEKSTLQIITSNDDQLLHHQSILTKSTQVNSVEQHLVQTFEQEDEGKKKRYSNQKQQNLKRKTENFSQILNDDSQLDNYPTKLVNQVIEHLSDQQIKQKNINTQENQSKQQVLNSQNYQQQQELQSIQKLNQIQENSQQHLLQQVQNTVIQQNQSQQILDSLIPNYQQQQNTIQKKNIQEQIQEQFEIKHNNKRVTQQIIELQQDVQKNPNNLQQFTKEDQLKLRPITQESQQNSKTENIIENQILLDQEQQQLSKIIQNEDKQISRAQSYIDNQFVEIQEKKQQFQITTQKEQKNDIINNSTGNQLLQHQEQNKYSQITPNDQQQNSTNEKINEKQIFQNQNQEFNYQQSIEHKQEQNSIAKNLNVNEIQRNQELKLQSETPPIRESQNSKINNKNENQINQIQTFQIETNAAKQNLQNKEMKSFQKTQNMQNDTSIDKLNELSEVQSNNLNESQEDQIIKIDIQSQKNMQQVRMLSSQQLTQYQEILQRLNENSTIQTKQIVMEQRKIVEEVQKYKEKLNSTREQEILSKSGDDMNFQKIPQTENYVSILKDMYLKLDQEEHLKILQQEIEKVYETENLHNFPIIKENDIFGNHQKGRQYRSIIEQLSQSDEKQKVQTNINPENIILSQSLIQLNNSGFLKNLDSPDRKQSARLLNQIRQSSVSDEIVPLLMQRFESLQQYQQTKVNQIKSPPNSKSQDYKSEDNLNTKLKKIEDFEIWSTNKKIKKFQIWKKTQPVFYEIPLEFKQLSLNCKNRMKIENQQYLFGGFTYNKLPHGLGIMMKKPQGAIYEGIFENGKFLYGLVLELNATQKLQKYIGNYHVEKQVKHGHCKLIWFEEIKNTGRFEIEEEHHGPIIFGQLMGQAKRWNLKENWLYIGGFHSSVKSGNGQVFKSDLHNEFQLQYEGEFRNNQFHGIGKYHHNKQLYEMGQYSNGNRVGVHELYKNHILQKQIIY